MKEQVRIDLLPPEISAGWSPVSDQGLLTNNFIFVQCIIESQQHTLKSVMFSSKVLQS